MKTNLSRRPRWASMQRRCAAALAGGMLCGVPVCAQDGGAATTASAPDAAAPVPMRVEVVASDLRVVWSMVFAPDGRMLFAERPGRVRVIENGRLRPEPLLSLPDVDATGKLGLMGLALHPRFADTRWLYAAYSYCVEGGQRVRVVRYREAGNALAERQVIIEGIPAATNHAGCRIKFGPDGKLYITTGDADKPPLAQSLESLAGKTLRLNEDGTVPQDNPFSDPATGRPSPVWSYGHRNAQGLDWQPGTGLLFQSEHGPNGGDEINVVEKGKNYGWPTVHHRLSGPDMESPLAEYTPSIGPGSGTFYRGTAFLRLRNSFLVGCLRGESILSLVLDGRRVMIQERLLEKQHGRIREVAEAPDGTIYFSTSQHDPPEGKPRPGYDQILRLVPAG